jgi:hypothetical protein
LQFRGTDNVWTTQILPANQRNHVLKNPAPDAISIRAVGRTGNLSAPAVVSRQKLSPVLNEKGRMDLNWPPEKQ